MECQEGTKDLGDIGKYAAKGRGVHQSVGDVL